MTKRDERAGGGEPPRTPRTRVVSEAVVAALSEEPPRPRTRVVSEAVVAAIPAQGEAEPGGGADGGAGG
jgi:hypothetical protein